MSTHQDKAFNCNFNFILFLRLASDYKVLAEWTTFVFILLHSFLFGV